MWSASYFGWSNQTIPIVTLLPSANPVCRYPCVVGCDVSKLKPNMIRRRSPAWRDLPFNRDALALRSVLCILLHCIYVDRGMQHTTIKWWGAMGERQGGLYGGSTRTNCTCAVICNRKATSLVIKNWSLGGRVDLKECNYLQESNETGKQDSTNEMKYNSLNTNAINNWV